MYAYGMSVETKAGAALGVHGGEGKSSEGVRVCISVYEVVACSRLLGWASG
jgi:hypothetical protein